MLFFIHNLESAELQVIGLIRRPQNWVIRSLGAVFYLTEALVYVCRSFADGLGEQLRRHEVGAGAGGKVAAVFY